VVLGKRFAVLGTNSEANSLSMEERAMLLDELVASGADPSRMMPARSLDERLLVQVILQRG
jgi:hypothetical protein